MSERSAKPYISIVKGIGSQAHLYLITAEYINGYDILGVYKTVRDARKDLPFIKRYHAKAAYLHRGD